MLTTLYALHFKHWQAGVNPFFFVYCQQIPSFSQAFTSFHIRLATVMSRNPIVYSQDKKKRTTTVHSVVITTNIFP